MSNYIILVKQVTDVKQITDNAFDPETGTLIRSRLASTINELDTQALAFADYMRKISGDAAGIITALTMNGTSNGRRSSTIQLVQMCKYGG
jgi:electron transfer flavoprotein alpha/beta subunit